MSIWDPNPGAGGGFFEQVLGGLGQVAGQVIPGLIVDRIGLNLDAPWEQSFSGPTNSIPNVFGLPDPADLIQDWLAPLPVPQPSATPPVQQTGVTPMQGYYTAEQVIASGNAGSYCVAGVGQNGALLFRRKRRRRRAPLTKSQMEAIGYMVGMFGKGSDTTKVAVTQILAK